MLFQVSTKTKNITSPKDWKHLFSRIYLLFYLLFLFSICDNNKINNEKKRPKGVSENLLKCTIMVHIHKYVTI